MNLIKSIGITAPGKYAIRNPTTVVPTRYLKMKPEMQAYLFGAESAHYIREVPKT